jgi:hypothetical protein
MISAAEITQRTGKSLFKFTALALVIQWENNKQHTSQLI